MLAALPLVTTAAKVSALGATALVAARAWSSASAERLRALPLFARAPHVREHVVLMRSLREFARLGEDETGGGDGAATLVELVEEALQRAANATAADLWQVHRLTQAAQRHAEALVQAAKKRSDDEHIVEACVQCQDEELGNLESVLEALVHNAIMDTTAE